MMLFTFSLSIIGFPRITKAQNTAWSPTHGPFGGSSVYSIFTEPDGSIYLGTYSDGVFRTEDNGPTWTDVTEDA